MVWNGSKKGAFRFYSGFLFVVDSKENINFFSTSFSFFTTEMTTKDEAGVHGGAERDG